MLKIENLLIAYYGFVAVLLMFLLAIYGGILTSLDSLLFLELSYTISPYSPFEWVTVPTYIFFNLSLFVFSILLCLRLHNHYAQFGSLYLSLASLIGILLILFPMDPPNSVQTLGGISHIIVALLMAVFIILGLISFAYSFSHLKNLSWLSKYSVIVSMIILFAGSLGAVSALLQMPSLVGLFQKLPISAFLVWVSLVSIGMLKSDKRIKHYFPF